MFGGSGLGMISSMELDERKDIQSIKSAFSTLHSKLQKLTSYCFLEGNNKEHKMNTNTKTCI